MNFTLFGYPKTGKTTLFNLLTGAKIEIRAYEEGKKEPHHWTVPVPDSRLDKIASLYPEKKKIAAPIDLIDLQGISYGEVKNSTFLNVLRKTDVLVHVVRGFLNAQIPHPKGKISPQEDILFMEEELILSDLLSAESRMERLEKDLKKTKDPEGEKEMALLKILHQALEEEKVIRTIALSPAEEKLIRSFAFLSQKPLLHMVNIDEGDISLLENPDKICADKKPAAEVMAFCGKIETEILELDEEEKAAFLAEYGLKELSAARFFRIAPHLLDNIFFYTVGKDEVRAWPIKRNTPAIRTAGAIHTDIEKGFIRAEVISAEELLKLGSLHIAKEKGAIRLEGKEYIVRDGDVIYFRFAS